MDYAAERVGFEPTVVAQPLTAIAGAASPELLQELKSIEENYRGRLKELENPVRDEDSGLERGIHNPKVGSSSLPRAIFCLH